MKTMKRTCFDCDHLHACSAWTGTGSLLHTDATNCANYQTTKELHWELMVAQEVIVDQNIEIERLKQTVVEQTAIIEQMTAERESGNEMT